MAISDKVALYHTKDGGVLVVETAGGKGLKTVYKCSVCGSTIQEGSPSIDMMDYPSAIVSGGQHGSIDEPVSGYMGKEKPDFVRADDENFSGK